MPILPAILISIAVIAITLALSRRHPVLPYPPLLPTWPLFGNFFSIPSQLPWKTYADWSKTLHSDLISVWAFGQLTVVINSKEVAKELLERRSAKYSDRPFPPMIKLLGWDFGTGMLPYGDKWRTRRRLMHKHFHSNAALAYRPLQEVKVRNFLRNVHGDNSRFERYLRVAAADISLSISYGHGVGDPDEDRFVRAAEDSMAMLSGAIFPGAMIVNVFPFLQHLPEWLPGMGFQAYARRCKEITSDMINAPWEFVKQGMADGTARPSMASTFISQMRESSTGEDMENTAKDACVITYVGTAMQTVAAVTSGVLALLLHPQVQRRAQKEIDTVVGRDRLPGYEDCNSLPYTEALYREVLRWMIVAPLSLPHAAYEDDVYEGYFIPKGVQVIINLWAMLHNPDEYPEPEVFKPERFLMPDGTLTDDSVKIVFGSGRRICSGIHLADSTIWLLLVSTLATFNIVPARDEYGSEIRAEVACTDGLVSHLLPFQCIFETRDTQAEVLLSQCTEADEAGRRQLNKQI
ncbi:cytochrome P450 [Dentipellis sp. KUC8613]|nr:cytochrome P450 [Dentipellis sp. KUC8613]